MYFITCRQPVVNQDGFVFDLNKNAPDNNIYFCKSGSDERHISLDSSNFMDEIRNHSSKHILFYIHGFNCMPNADVLPMAQKLQDTILDEYLVIPIIWACDNDFGLVKDYWDDQKSADNSVVQFSRALMKFADWQKELPHKCSKDMSILAHSMGNRVLRGTLSEFAKYYCDGYMPMIFNTIYMVAADVRYDTLEDGNKGEYIADASDNLYVFYNTNDKALKASKIANLKNRRIVRRLGLRGCKNELNNVVQINCTGAMSDVLNHTYFYDSIITDIINDNT